MTAPSHPPPGTAWRTAALTLLLAALAAVPLAANDYQLFRLTNVLVYALALVGMNLLTGYNGQISLGHGAFYAIGAYTTALLMVQADVPHWLALPMAAVTCFVAGFLFSLPLLGLKTMHLAMATFAIGVVLPTLVKWKGVEQFTGGTQGLGLADPPVPGGLPLRFDQWMYLLALTVLVAGFWLTRNLLQGRVGRAVIAIRDHPIAAQSMGIDFVWHKAAVFGLSAALVGVAGGLGALAMRYVAPGLYGPFLSFSLLIGIAAGGLGTLSGALYGAVALQGIFLVVGVSASTLRTSNAPLIYGVVLVAFLCLVPDGVAGLVRRAAARWRRWREAAAPSPTSTALGAKAIR